MSRPDQEPDGGGVFDLASRLRARCQALTGALAPRGVITSFFSRFINTTNELGHAPNFSYGLRQLPLLKYQKPALQSSELGFAMLFMPLSRQLSFDKHSELGPSMGTIGSQGSSGSCAKLQALASRSYEDFPRQVLAPHYFGPLLRHASRLGSTNL